MRKRSPSFNEGYSSSSSASPTTRQRAFEHQCSSSRTRSRPRPHPRDGEPTLLGSVGTLVRLALVALVLALVVPYIRTHLFRSSAKSVDARVGKNAYHHHEPPPVHVGRNVGEEGKGEVDVFNFSHQGYLAAAGRADKRKAVASASPTAVVAAPSSKRTQQQQQQQQQKERKSTTRTRSNTHTNRSNDDEDEEDDEQPPSTTFSILTLLSTLYALTLTTLRFASIPFVHLFRLTLSLISTSYHAFRFSLSHTLRPILHLLAPLTYLVSGILFVFVQTPIRVLTVVAIELYPVYIFLGAATVVGLTMGVVSAGVMYLSAFVFVDRLNIHPVTDDRRMVEEEKEEEGGMSGSAFSPVGRGGFGQNVQQSYFPTPMANLYSSPLPSPTTPYRPPPTTSDLRKGHPPYSGVPGSSLRASVA
ncbi:uncharacterized protein SPSC_04972 [Sporisorium scitamineum]|uniref:Uncharacterized protein n=1 Tax=Sporisorium scitamineum TaxID=49012 RepID=A0A127ZG96_9BASI|nr:uncharacterized protein SPSC_04972 [Sporisorium scitamineum]